MQCLGERYRLSAKACQVPPGLACPFHDKELVASRCGRICMHLKKVDIATVMAAHRVGLKEVDAIGNVKLSI